MTLFNVRMTVVELIEADTAEDAIARLSDRCRRAAMEVYTDDPHFAPDAFESEPLP